VDYHVSQATHLTMEATTRHHCGRTFSTTETLHRNFNTTLMGVL